MNPEINDLLDKRRKILRQIDERKQQHHAVSNAIGALIGQSALCADEVNTLIDLAAELATDVERLHQQCIALQDEISAKAS